MISATRSSLLRKHMLFAIIGLVSTLGLFGFWSLHALEESTQEILSERLVIAETMAMHVEEHLQDIVSQLEGTATDLADQRGLSPDAARAILRPLYLGSQSRPVGAYVLDQTGTMVLAEPAHLESADLNFKKYTFVNDALVKGQIGVSGAMTVPGTDRLGVMIAVPIKDRDGLAPGGIAKGVLLAMLDASSPTALGVVGSIKLGETGYAQVVDDDGQLIASTRPEDGAREIDHGPRFTTLIKTGQKTVAACHRCHESGARQLDVIAFAPVSGTPWGIAIRQSQDEAFALVNDLRWKILAISIISVLVLGGLALTVLRDIITPIRRLTTSAQGITSGDFGGSIPQFGTDEIGALARTLEAMRCSLNTAREEMALRNEELHSKTEKLQRKEEQHRQLLDRFIQAQEDERKRIARELHDEIGQTLTALVMSLDAVDHILPHDAGALKERLEGMRDLTSNTIRETRRLMLDLRPTVLDDLGLVPAIEWYAETHLARAGISLRVKADSLPSRLPPPMETVLFRVAQEAMTNSIRHSGARKMRINLETTGSAVEVTIEDDGRGFDVQCGAQGGMGLLGMEERVSLIGGEFRLESGLGKGTRIKLEIPWDEGGRNGQNPRVDS